MLLILLIDALRIIIMVWAAYHPKVYTYVKCTRGSYATVPESLGQSRIWSTCTFVHVRVHLMYLALSWYLQS